MTNALLPAFSARVARFMAGAALLTAAGCANVHNIEVGSIPDDYRTRHPIVVSEAPATTDIPVVVSDAALSSANRGRVEDFSRRFHAAKADTMQVLVPTGAANQYAADRIAQDIVATLRANGISRDRVYVQPYSVAGILGPTPIKLAYTTLVAKTEACGRWPGDLGDSTENKNYFNFGCASQQNLAAQIADPRDLLSPRGTDAIDAQRRTTVLDNYRRGQPTQSAPGPSTPISQY